MTWREDWALDIYEATKDLPDDAPLAERIKIVDQVRDGCSAYSSTSWGKKSWQAARRDYLVRFGYVPKTKKAKAAGDPLPLFDADTQ